LNPIRHTSVLLEEAVSALTPTPGKVYADGTLGGGGHARRLCDFLDESNTLIGIDQDPTALAEAQKGLSTCQVPVKLVQGNFGELHRHLLEAGVARLDGGLLLDLGVSDFQIRTPERGFSFQHSAPLDMRMDPALSTTAADLVNTLAARELADLFYKYADEKLSRPIAAAILQARPLSDTLQLAKIAENLYRQKGVKAKNIHPATRIFQALRIAVNREMEVLEKCLDQLPTVLAPGARVAIITFHSLEDRMVKQYFREASATCLCPPRQPICTCTHQPAFKVIGKPITASEAEVTENPQSRSAKLRVAERI
jgi:16S rRNA (cytosine1402-N4)-methyltransferase